MLREYGTLYDAIGGAPVLRRIVEAFYPKVQAHPLLGPLFPEDLRPVMEKQFMFLSQFFGGPPLYSEAYGHPMMRARHLPFRLRANGRTRGSIACAALLKKSGLRRSSGNDAGAVVRSGLSFCEYGRTRRG